MLARTLVVLLLLSEIYVLGYATLVAFVISGWFESDMFALQANEADWILLAVKRLILITVFAVLISFVLMFINRLLVHRQLITWPNLPRLSFIISLLLIIGSGLTGSALLIINKPFI